MISNNKTINYKVVDLFEIYKVVNSFFISQANINYKVINYASHKHVCVLWFLWCGLLSSGKNNSMLVFHAVAPHRLLN